VAVSAQGIRLLEHRVGSCLFQRVPDFRGVAVVLAFPVLLKKRSAGEKGARLAAE
jgi:hypothetical protein